MGSTTHPYTSDYSGVIEAHQTTPLSFASPGTVLSVAVQEGQSVRKGQLLGKVDASTAENTYQLARQKEQQAQDAYNRLKPMHENGTLPDIKWVEAETGLAQTKTAVAMALKSVRDCNLYAPESGIIGRKQMMPGMNVLPGTPVLDLLDIKTVYARIPVPENEIALLRKGNIAHVTIKALDRTLSGTIREIGVAADPLSHTYPVKIQLPNPDQSIKPGMLSAVRLSLTSAQTGLLISNKALQSDAGDQEFVYVVVDQRARKRRVKTRALVGEGVLVSGDLKPGDQIVVAGQDKLSPGSPVKISQYQHGK
ncbi:hypothetical protein BLX24_27160 [Arsenicibacter rosenii]|uniref:Uncharacterized protein n=1 Tax=Arsenicibacter rosenii TaxID=1750698 RepID=A0A1S2VCJ8_9BACT|nr:hypothetical protein BLX24_27160 [Arsenicibacter rosenii]